MKFRCFYLITKLLFKKWDLQEQHIIIFYDYSGMSAWNMAIPNSRILIMINKVLFS